MPVLAVVSLLIQIGLVIHVVRSGNDRFWIYLIIFVPAIGSAVYFFTQVLPELGRSRGVRRAKNTLIRAIDPQRELRRRKEELELSDSVENRVRLADECVEAGLDAEAVALYRQALSGVHAHDAGILLKLADALFRAGEYAECRRTLDTLMEHNPDFRSPDGHLLYARALQELGESDAALEEFVVLADSYPGEEARVRYAELLLARGDIERARAIAAESLLRARRAPAYYRKKEKKWLERARQLST